MMFGKDPLCSTLVSTLVVNGLFLIGPEPETVYQFDALLSAAVARNGCKHVWTTDLTDLPRGDGEMDPQHRFFGKVNYYWFEHITV